MSPPLLVIYCRGKKAHAILYLPHGAYFCSLCGERVRVAW